MIKVNDNDIIGVYKGDTPIIAIYKGENLVWNGGKSTERVPVTLHWNFVNSYTVNGKKYFPKYIGEAPEINWEVQTGEWIESEGDKAVDGKMFTCISPGTSKTTVIRCTFKNMSSITFNFRSDAESTYDYLIASKLDASLSSIESWSSTQAYIDENVQEHTRGSQGLWKKVTYSIPNNVEGEHFVEFMFGKDHLSDVQPDNAKVYISDYKESRIKFKITQLKASIDTKINWNCEVEDTFNDYITDKGGSFILEGATDISPFEGLDIFPSYVDETSSFAYVKDAEYFIMKDGEAVSSNMDIIILNDGWLTEEFLPKIESLTSSTSRRQLYKVTTVEPVNIDGSVGDLYDVAFINCPQFNIASIGGCAPDALNCKLFTGNFWGIRFGQATSLGKVVCPDIAPTVSCESMFEGCSALREVHNMPFDMEVSAENMFKNCTELVYVSPSNYIVESRYTFNYCDKLESSPLRSYLNGGHQGNFLRWSGREGSGYELTEPLTVVSRNAQQTFGDSGLKGKVDVTITTDGCYGMFYNTNIEEAKLTIIRTLSLGAAFDRCSKLKKVYIDDVSSISSASNQVGMSGTFGSCENLRYIYLGNFSSNVLSFDPKFQECPWGEGSEENRQSVIDTLLNDSVDLAAQNKSATVNISEITYDLLTKEERNAIRAKGYALQRNGVATTHEN